MDGLLVLADGTVLRGQGFGAKGTAIGEVVFNTGMSGYQEVITDPSYTGQLITFTYPELGNTGVNTEDLEADAPAVKAVLCRCLAPEPSNWRSRGRLEQWLEQHDEDASWLWPVTTPTPGTTTTNPHGMTNEENVIGGWA